MPFQVLHTHSAENVYDLLRKRYKNRWLIFHNVCLMLNYSHWNYIHDTESGKNLDYFWKKSNNSQGVEFLDSLVYSFFNITHIGSISLRIYATLKKWNPRKHLDKIAFFAHFKRYSILFSYLYLQFFIYSLIFFIAWSLHRAWGLHSGQCIVLNCHFLFLIDHLFQ